MLNTDITLAGDSSSTRTYALRSIEGGNSFRANASAPNGEAETLTVKHSSNKNGSGIAVKRHLVRLDLQKVNAAGIPVNAAVYVVVEVPVDPAITVAYIKDMRTQMTNFLVNANVDKILSDEP